MSKETMKLALEALKQIDEAMPFPVAKLAQAALREALAKPDFWEGYVPEPVKPAQDSGVVTAGGFDPRTQRTWVGLTDEEIDDCWNNLFGTGNYNRRNVYQAIEAKLRSKNEDRN